MKENFATENQTIAEEIKAIYKPQTITIMGHEGEDIHVLAVPTRNGIELKSTVPFTDEYLTAPKRRKGVAQIKSLESFIAHVNRFKDKDSALFANPDKSSPSLQAVLNYHKSGEIEVAAPRFGDHRTAYSFPLSKEWNLWNRYHGKEMKQAEFAEFLEDNITDVRAPIDEEITGKIQELRELIGGNFASPQKLMQLSKGLSVTESSKVKNSTNLATGETSIVYETEHTDGAGAPVNVPNFFLITIPVFEMGQPYLMAVRLRYRIRSGAIAWIFQLCRIENVFDDAFEEACNQAKDETALPLFVGSPE